jgi:cytochrome c oxidase assembly protein subunit 15
MASPLWSDRSRRRSHPRARTYHYLTPLTVAFVYVQLVLGAEMRHIPVTASRFLFNMCLILHLANAAWVAVHVTLVGWTLGRMREERALQRPALALVTLFFAQLVLGAATWIVTFGWHYWFAAYRFAAAYLIQTNSMLQTITVTLHMAVGSLVLATAVSLSLRSRRLLRCELASLGPAFLLLGFLT